MCSPFSIIVIILQVYTYLFAQLSVRNDLSYRYIKGNNADTNFRYFIILLTFTKVQTKMSLLFIS